MTITDNGAETVYDNAPPPQEQEEQAVAVVEIPPPDLEVEVVDDTPPADRGHKPAAPGVKPYDPDEDPELKDYDEKSRVKRRFATMKWQQHEERRNREKAERERDAAIQYAKTVADQNKRLFQESHSNRKTAVTAVNSKLDVELEQARAAVKQAFDLGDGEAMAAAQQRMSEAAAKKQSVAGYQVDDQAAYEPPPLPQIEPDNNVSERASRWQGANPWFQPGKNSPSFYALEVHQALMQRGVQPDSEAYFEAIDNAVQKKFPELFPDRQAQQPTQSAQPQMRRSASIVAPVVSRDPSTGKRKVTLTEGMAEVARKLGIPIKTYAEQLVAEQEEDRR